MTPTPRLKRTLFSDMSNSLNMALISLLLFQLDHTVMAPIFGVFAILDAVLNVACYKIGAYAE